MSARPSNSSLSVKRVRRTLEPEQKTWNDELLDLPWDDIVPRPSVHTLFAMKNIFFFSHATAVQAAAIAKLQSTGNSAVVEAPTGCGKTLAFLVPVMERIVASCERHIAIHQRPILTRRIVAIALSPSRVLAEQTFVVARNLAARFPHNIHVMLCDGVMERADAAVERACQASRGAGILLISTPSDVVDFMTVFHAKKAEIERQEARQLSKDARQSASDGDNALLAIGKHDVVSVELLEAQSEETRQRYLKKLESKRLREAAVERTVSATAASTPSTTAVHQQLFELHAHENDPFFLILDEADVILRGAEMREHVMHLLNHEILPFHKNQAQPTTDASGASPLGKKSKTKKDSGNKMKRGREDPVEAGTVTLAEGSPVRLDVCLCGATAGMSQDVASFKAWVQQTAQTTFHDVLLRKSIDFTSQLTNQYIVCEANSLLQNFVHSLNLHPSKKHFVFFNSTPVLLFVKALLQALSKGTRSVLFVKHIYAMYDEMKESTRFAEYNAFLEHTPSAIAAAMKPKKPQEHQQQHHHGGPAKSFAEEKNQVFSSGWKRDGAPPPGTGAVLLCTDLAAFGLDVRDVDYVYHFEPPTSMQSYLHRIGRVGRMGMRGTSVLLLPTFVADRQKGQSLEERQSRERKTTSLRFNTITNTKSQTSSVQSRVATESDLEGHHADYLQLLQAQHRMHVHSMPPVAPITPSIRAAIQHEGNLLKLAQQAAMALCRDRSGENNEADDDVKLITDEKGEEMEESSNRHQSWFDPALAVATLLLD